LSDLIRFQRIDIFGTGELAALIAIYDFRPAMPLVLQLTQPLKRVQYQVIEKAPSPQ